MDSDSDEDIWIMEDTKLDELVEDEGQKFKVVFDYMTDRYFFMKLKEIITGKTLRDPLCERKEGRPPKESIEPDFNLAPIKVETPPIEEIGEEFYGDNEFDDDEISDFSQLSDEDM